MRFNQKQAISGVLAMFVAIVSAVSAEVAPLAAPLPKAYVCPKPEAPCARGSFSFAPYDLSFHLPAELAWQTAHNSEHFYAILLASAKAIHPDPGDPDDETECAGYFSEKERSAVQKLFPDRKVFASRHGCAMVWYNGVNDQFNFMAVYAGEQLEDARAVLQTVKDTGRFPAANIRKIQVVVDNVH